jgi:hypothetical protein
MQTQSEMVLLPLLHVRQLPRKLFTFCRFIGLPARGSVWPQQTA